MRVSLRIEWVASDEVFAARELLFQLRGHPGESVATAWIRPARELLARCPGALTPLLCATTPPRSPSYLVLGTFAP